MGRLTIGEETSTPATPTAGITQFATVATPSIFKMVDDAGVVYTFALLEKTQTFSGDVTINRLIIGTGATLTIASGVVTVTNSLHSIDTEAAAASDDLNTINGGVLNQLLILRTVSSARDVVIKNLVGGADNIITRTGADITLGSSNSRYMFMYNGTNWLEIGSWAS